mgnify:CR=1 FL=1
MTQMVLFNIKENTMYSINIIHMMKTGDLCTGDMLKVKTAYIGNTAQLQ